MSTTTLSQRLRALASTVHTVELIEPLREMAAMAEAQEAQAGELSDDAAKDEAVKRYGPAFYMPGDPRHDMQTTVAFYSCYEWLRDMNCLKPSQAIGEQTPVAWIHEDTLPEGYPYHLMFPYSEVRDFVRMFPVYGPSPMSSEARDRAIEWLGDAQHHLSNGRIGEVCIAIDQALSALSGE